MIVSLASQTSDGHWHAVLPEAIVGTFDADHHGLMQQPVQQCGSDHQITEHLSPFREAAVGGQDHVALFLSCADQLEKQAGTFLEQRQVANLIDDKQCETAHLAKSVILLSTGEDAVVFHRHIETMVEISREVAAWQVDRDRIEAKID